MKRYRFFFSLCITLGVLVSTFSLFYRNKPGFTLEKIRSPFPPSPQWKISSLTPKETELLQTILAQNFHYLACGAQCFAFVSEDGRYVLKFFKMKHFIPKTWLKWLPLPCLKNYRVRKIDKRIFNHNQIFSNYKIAYEELQKETGLVYIHLNKSKDLKISVTLRDRKGHPYVAPLDEFEFVLQKKGQIASHKIKSCVQNGNIEGALSCIKTLLQHITIQCQKGFIDKDSGLLNNYGFVEDQAIHFDVGRLIHIDTDPSLCQQQQLRALKKLEEWSSTDCPSLLPSLKEKKWD